MKLTSLMVAVFGWCSFRFVSVLLLFAFVGGRSLAAECTTTGPYLCPTPRCGTQPKFFVMLESERPDPIPPAWQDLCPPPPNPPCVKAPTPVLDSSAAVGAQELVFKVDINENSFCPRTATWLIEYKEGGVWKSLYTLESPESIHYQIDDAADSTKTTLRFGATGLKVGLEHRVAVAFCCDVISIPEIPDCTCISNWGYANPSATPPVGYVPGTFRSGNDLPLVPAGFTQEIEDNFRRPRTRAKRGSGSPPPPLGDGLGPPTVWNDENPLANIFNGSRIGDAEGYALLPVNAAAEFEIKAQHPHTFVETKLALDANANSSLNFDLRARRFMQGSVVYSYFVKIARGGLQGSGTRPDIVVAVTPAPDPLPAGWVKHDSVGQLPSWAEMKRFTVPESADSLQPQCFGNPPIAPNGVGSVWIRLEVEDLAPPTNRPKVTAWLTWHETAASECGVTGEITSCPRVCKADATDTSVNAGIFLGQIGNFGYDAHEKNYRMPVWRAGSKP